jgi:hypothetical protein
VLKKSTTGSEREVLFRLRAQGDKNNPREFKRMGDEALKTQKTIDDGVRNSAKVRKQVTDQSTREQQKADRDAEREADRLHKRHRERQLERAKRNREVRDEEERKVKSAEEQAAKDRKKAYEDDLKESIRVGNEKTKEANKAARDRQKAERQAIREQEQAAARARAAQQRSIEGTRQMIEGSLKLGRALALTGAVGEKEMEKVVQTLLKVQIAMDGVRGGMDLVQGLGKTAIGGRVLGMLGGSGPVLAGAAAAASWATVLKLVYETLSGSASKLGSWTNKIAEAEVGVVNFIAKMMGFDPLGDKAVEKAEKRRALLQDQLSTTERLGGERVVRQAAIDQIRREGTDASLEMRNANDPTKILQSRRGEALTRLGQAESFERQSVRDNEFNTGANRVSEVEIARSIQQQVEAYREMRDLKRQEWDIRREANSRDKDTQMATIQSYRQQLDLVRQRRREILNDQRSMLASVAESDPATRNRAAYAFDKIQRGETLTPEEAAAAKPFATERERRRIEDAENKGFAQRNPNDRLSAHIRRQFDEERRRNAERERDAAEAIRSSQEQVTALHEQFKAYTETTVKGFGALTKLIEDSNIRLQDQLERNAIQAGGS